MVTKKGKDVSINDVKKSLLPLCKKQIRNFNLKKSFYPNLNAFYKILEKAGYDFKPSRDCEPLVKMFKEIFTELKSLNECTNTGLKNLYDRVCIKDAE